MMIEKEASPVRQVSADLLRAVSGADPQWHRPDVLSVSLGCHRAEWRRHRRRYWQRYVRGDAYGLARQSGARLS